MGGDRVLSFARGAATNAFAADLGRLCGKKFVLTLFFSFLASVNGRRRNFSGTLVSIVAALIRDLAREKYILAIFII